MDARQARDVAREWVAVNLDQWPGLRAAHLVGGLTTMPDDAPFPSHKDVDVHLVFDEDSPALLPAGPFPPILEVSAGGLAIEAGLKSVAEYRSAAAVLANPEIAYHLTVDSLLHDPSGLLRDLRDEVVRDYPRRRWVHARIDHERAGLADALALRPMVAAAWGASGEALILGYSATFVAAALNVATLAPPRMGGRMLVHLREVLAAQDRLDLHEEMLAVQGVQYVTPALVERTLGEAAETFDLAVAVRRTPHPFQHKLHRHLRPYFVESARGMLRDGFHREAMAWVVAFAVGTTDVVLADGPEEVKPELARRRATLLGELGLVDDADRTAAFARAERLYDRAFALAREMVDRHPGTID